MGVVDLTLRRPSELELDCAYDFAADVPLSAGMVRILVAEVRRLRSDEWLEKAAREIADDAQTDLEYREDMTWDERTGHTLAILRKHRDGKA